MSALVWIGVALLGGVGATCRFLLDGFIAERIGSNFPVGTLTINVTGALVLGLLTGLAVKGDLLVLAGTASLGSYTTFSTWMLESQRLAEDNKLPSAALNVTLSLAIGIGAAGLGYTIGTHS